MRLTERRAELAIAGAIVAAAAAISPIGIRLATGRLDLSPRIVVLSLTFDLFLLIFAAAVLARGRARRVCLHIAAWVFPLALLAAIETAAIALKLADRIAPLEDFSVLADAGGWPPYLMSLGRKASAQQADLPRSSRGDGIGPAPSARKAARGCWLLDWIGLGLKDLRPNEITDDLQLYRPWRGEGISINELGLRTAPPSPKAAGEWRIAVAGASAAWGWRVLDADTIPVRLQALLRGQGHPNVTVYNFAIDSITLAGELEVVRRFRDVYAIDQVVFYTGANNVTADYLDATAPPDCFAGLIGGANMFELIKVAARLKARLAGPPPALLARLDQDMLPALGRDNSLRTAVVAANDYCRAVAMRCDILLQPVLPLRKPPRGAEIPLARTLAQVHPRYAEAFAAMYRSARDLELPAGVPVRDLSDLFDRSAAPYFFDAVHVNEAGNTFAAEQIAGIVAAGIPPSGNDANGAR
jgi:lysophospholipase L1-like esterase